MLFPLDLLCVSLNSYGGRRTYFKGLLSAFQKDTQICLWAFWCFFFFERNFCCAPRSLSFEFLNIKKKKFWEQIKRLKLWHCGKLKSTCNGKLRRRSRRLKFLFYCGDLSTAAAAVDDSNSSSTVATCLQRCRSWRDTAVEEEFELSTVASGLLRCSEVGADCCSLKPFIWSHNFWHHLDFKASEK